MPTKVEVVSDRGPEHVSFEPIAEGVEPLTYKGRFAVEVKLYALTEDLLGRKQLISARDGRWCRTGYRLIMPDFIQPMLFSATAILDKNLEALSWQKMGKDRELMIRVQSFNQAQAIYLEHGTPLCILHFVSTVRIESSGSPPERPAPLHSRPGKGPV